MNKIRKDFNKLGRTNSDNSSMPNSRSNARADKRTPLNPGGQGSNSGTLTNGADNNNSNKLFSDDHRPWVKWPVHVAKLTWHILATNYVNVLLVFVPAGIVLGVLDVNPTAIFIVNFLAIIPLASLLGFATEELSAKLGQTIGGLMNATFGNAVELIVSIIALTKGEIRIVQASMLGSILSNILLVLGCCFISSGIRRNESSFNATVASTMSSLMAVAATSLIIPATLYASLARSNQSANDNILVLSRGTSIILLILYCLYLYFQLKSHADLFDAEMGEDDEQEEPQLLGPISASVLLLVITVLVAVCADYLVASIDSIVASTGISKTFIGLILIPIVGNAAEHVTAVVVAYKNKMDLAIGVAIGSSMQIALFVTPFMVILGWIIGQDMSLHFHTFETVVLFVSVLVVNYLIQDGKSNYLEGYMCLGTYIIIAIAFYVYPDDVDDSGIGMLFGKSQ